MSFDKALDFLPFFFTGEMKGGEHGRYRFSSFLLDAAERELLRGDEPVPLAPKSFDTLLYLVKNGGHLVTKDELMAAVWPDSFVEEGNLCRAVHNLRKALGEDQDGNKFIKTVPTKGYRFVAEIKRMANADPPETSIAVLPLDNGTGDGGLDYLADGFSEALIDHLSKSAELRVIARNSSFKFRGWDVDLAEVSNELSVRMVVIGRIAKSEENLNIRAELVDARENRQLWSESYTLQTTDFQSVQLEVANRIMNKLVLQPNGTYKAEAGDAAPINHEAYEQYLTGLFVARTSQKRALDHFIRATRLDPGFAQAFYRVSQHYFNLGYNTELDPRETAPKVRAALQRALQLDDKLPGAYLLRAKIKLNEWDWDGAEEDFSRVIAVNPHTVEAHEAKAEQLARAGKVEEAVKESRLRQMFDPLAVWPKIQEGRIYYCARRYDKAVDQFQHVVKLAPDHYGARVWLGVAFAAQGSFREAIAEYECCGELMGDVTSLQCYRGYAWAKLGKRRKAIETIEKLKTTKEYVSPAQLAILYAGLGDKAAAFTALEQAYNERDGYLQNLENDHHYNELRNAPRFDRLLQRVGLK